MPKESKNSARVASLARSVRARRLGGSRLWGWSGRLVEALMLPALGAGLLTAVLFAVASTLVVQWTRNQPLVAVGRVMDETRLVRVPLSMEDRAQTLQSKELARQQTPRIYVADVAGIDALIASLENLPRTLAGVESLAQVDPSVREPFALTPDSLASIKQEAVDGQTTSLWTSKVRTLGAYLRARPILDAASYQRGRQEGSHSTIRLVVAGEATSEVPRGEILNADDAADLSRAMTIMARDAGFTGALRTLVVNRLTWNPRPTFTFDSAATAQAQNEAAETVKTILVTSPVGQTIFQRGDPLAESQRDLFAAELNAFAVEAEDWKRYLRTGGITAAVFGITAAISGYAALFCPRIRREPGRIAALAALMFLALVGACFGTATLPNMAALTTVAPTLFVTMLGSIAYDRRAALAFGLLHGLLASLALREGLSTVAVMVTGIACVACTLKEIRDRHTLFRTSVFTALGVAAATIVFSLIERPLVSAVVREALLDSALAGVGALAMGGITLFTLPLIERGFGVTTGMTLIDLRDPKQPLLRELQQRAPGTYNHSLNVAAIAEAAADAIGADALLTYVGALYHDVGKMNKPEYFVENQAGGPNKHDKLSPAMSLLIVVGHVKDGVELARDFGLPARIQHFIEAHHGTTLVEFFYHRARQIASGDRTKDEGEDGYVPDEFEYRYPGPKPKTKEVAILMIADAVESAARAMSETTPGRIDALVRSIANKRLLDGQFDDCELTLKDLHQIVESVSRTVASMHHTRVSYPTESVEREPQRA